jgi:putative transposase
LSIREGCRLLGYSKQGYQKREKVAIKQQTQSGLQGQVVLNSVKAIREDMPRIGTRKLYHLLRGEFEAKDIKVGRDKLFSILRASNLLVIKRKRRVWTTDSSGWTKQYEDLRVDFIPEKPEELLVCDITYFDTDMGNVYGQLVSDGYSKKVMGYEAAYDMRKERTLAAFDKAMANKIYDHTGIHHSDRGSQYRSAEYVSRVHDSQYEVSMTQDGSPYDNAVAERINGILKEEFGLGERMKDLEEVKTRLERAIEIYNNKRPHWSCHLLTPNEMHQQQVLKVVTWRTKYKRENKNTDLNNQNSSDV